jgi:hypothetical protein
MIDQPTYDTPDIGIAAALYVAGVPQVGVVREPPSTEFRRGRAIFCFSESEAQAKLQEYLCGRLHVDAKALISQLNENRRLIYNKEALSLRVPKT